MGGRTTTQSAQQARSNRVLAKKLHGRQWEEGRGRDQGRERHGRSGRHGRSSWHERSGWHKWSDWVDGRCGRGCRLLCVDFGDHDFHRWNEHPDPDQNAPGRKLRDGRVGHDRRSVDPGHRPVQPSVHARGFCDRHADRHLLLHRPHERPSRGHREQHNSLSMNVAVNTTTASTARQWPIPPTTVNQDTVTPPLGFFIEING